MFEGGGRRWRDGVADDPVVCPGGLSRREAWCRVEVLRQAWAERAEVDLMVAEDASARVRLGDLAAVDALGEVDFASMGCDELLGSVLSLERTRRRVDAAIAVAMGAMERCAQVDASVGLSPARWRAHRTSGSDVAARRDLRVARVIRHFPGFDQLFRDANVSLDHLVVLANVVNARNRAALCDIEDRLIDIALTESFRRYRAQVTHIARLLDPDGAEPDCSERDRARIGAGDDGTLRLFAELTGHNAVVAERILAQETDRQYRAAVTEAEQAGATMPGVEVLRARALVELLRRASATEGTSAGKPRVEALLPVHIDRDHEKVSVTTSDGRDLDDTTAAALLCDAFVQPISFDPAGEPLNAGRTRRLFSNTQRNALILRDGGCVFPGCDAPASWCDAHHVTWYSHGGPTDASNGALLCRRHHGLVHSNQRWQLQRRDTDGQHRLMWENPHGQHITAQTRNTRHKPSA